MSRHQDIETRLRDVLDCVAQIHRRELQARAHTRKALAGSGCAERLSDSSVASFHGRSTTSIPLTLEPQLIRIPRTETPTNLWATPLTSSDRARPAIELTIHSHPAREGSGAGNESRGIRLLPYRPYRLLTIAPGTESAVASIARTEGSFCVLRLELVEQGSEREASLQAAAAAAEDPLEASRDGGRVETLASTGPGTAASSAAAALDQQLWGGYSAYALPALERLKFDPCAAPKERANAAWFLTRWHFVAQDFAAALRELRFAKSLPVPTMPRLTLAEARCLLHVGRCREAVELLQSPPSRASAVDFLLLESTAVRRDMLLNDGEIEAAEALQLERINQALSGADLAPVAKRNAAARLSLANIEARAQAGPMSQSRKVSVVMPAFNCATSIVWALRSLLCQTWQNIEIIVVDDASEDATAETVTAICATDSRVRLIRQEMNTGSYVARNAGAALATGDLVMVHDADDWSHPQLIERQIELLDAYPNALGVKSHWVRVNEDFEIVGTWMPRDSIQELNFSSLMFRRELLEILGGWDEVRVAGDAEFYSRFRAVFGEQSIVTMPRNCPLAFSLTREDSLTRSTATHLKSMYHGIRRNYTDAYRWWHRQLSRDAASPIPSASRERAFPAPLGNLADAPDDPRFDLIVIADFAASCAAFDNAISVLVAAARSGKQVAALHRRHFELTNREALRSEFYRTCHEHRIEILSAGDRVSADLVVIASPALFMQAVSPGAVVRTDNLIVLVDCGPRAPGAWLSEHGSPLDARQHLLEDFAREGRWLPTSEAAARMMREDHRYPRPCAGVWQPVVDADRLAERPIRWRGGDRTRPVVGRRIVGALDWPSRRSELDLVYGAREKWDVRFHSDNTDLCALLHDAPDHWQVVSEQTVSGAEFLCDLDFYIAFPHELHADELSQGLLDAMALGIPIIAPHRYHAMLGDAVSYAAPEQVAATIESLWSSERDYLERAAAARSFVIERFRIDDFMAALQRVCAEEPTVVQFERNTAVRSVS